MPSQRPHESARACGCDSANDYICERHGNVVDLTRTELRCTVGGRLKLDGTLYVSGPDSDGDFSIIDGEGYAIWLQRFVAEDVIRELQRRLDLKG